jgi:ribosomal protein L6P/L9E
MTQFKTYTIKYPKDILIKIFYNKTQGLYTLILFGFNKQLKYEVKDIFNISQDSINRTLTFTFNSNFSDLKLVSVLWRAYQVILTNIINDFSYGYEVMLELRGVGYKAFVEQNKLVLALGFSHPVTFEIPEKISVKIVDTKNILFSIAGFDRKLVHEFAAKIRSFKKPEPYKGKGVCYFNEIVTIKESKKEQ